MARQKIKWLLFHEPAELFIRTAEDFQKHLDTLTNNKYEIEILTLTDYQNKYLDGLICDPFTELKEGKVQCSQLFSDHIGDYDATDFYALSMPYLFKDHDHASRVFEGEVGKDLFEHLYQKTKVRGLSFTYSGGYRCTASNTPIRSIEDFAGKTYSRWRNPVHADMIDMVGAKKVCRLTDTDVKPFLKVFLPEKNVLGVTAVLEKDGTNIQALPKSTEFINSPNQWYEVEALAQDKVFTLDPTKNSDSPGLKIGKWKKVDKRFTTEYTPEGFFHLTLGGGTSSGQDALDDFANQGLAMDLNKYLNNLSLGQTAKANSTLFIQYRIGGGTATNVGPNSITSLGQLEFIVNGPVESINQQVKNSLTVNNITSAVGGANQPTVEEIRNYVSFNFSAQHRAVTVSDYKAIIDTMPGVFGAPAKVGIVEEENKILVNLLSYSDSGKLSSKVSTTLMSNIAEYLSDYRMLNDYITVKSAQVVDLALEIDILADPTFNQGEIVTNIVNQVDEFFSPNKKEMGQNCYVGQLSKNISIQDGVINLIDLRVINKVGGEYSDNQVSQRYSNPDTRQVELIDGVIFAQPNQSFQIQFPEKDVSIRIKSNTQASIS